MLGTGDLEWNSLLQKYPDFYLTIFQLVQQTFTFIILQAFSNFVHFFKFDSNMKECRENQIQEISNLWKKLANIEPVTKMPKGNILNSVDKNFEEKYYGFLVRKTKIPSKSMQRDQISQKLEPANDKNEIWAVSPLEDIEKNLTCEEQIINYKQGEGYI